MIDFDLPIFELTSMMDCFHSEKGTWFYLTVDKETSEQIRFLTSHKRKAGFGSHKVKARIGESVWTSSIFPNKSEKTFILLVKASIRKTENITKGDKVRFTIDLL